MFTAEKQKLRGVIIIFFKNFEGERELSQF